MSRHITLLGAGLTGPLLAIYLARRGHRIDIYERRPDMRIHDVGGGRSINLALSTRGINALEQIGVAAEVLGDAIPMSGRMIHGLDGSLDFQPYGKEGEAINSISRSGLNIELMNAAERCGGITFTFDARCERVDLAARRIYLSNDQTQQAWPVDVETLIGTDGSGSALRQSMEEQLPEFDSKVEWLEHGYKELEIPAGPDGEFLMEKNALHIWPRHEFMMIALPNPDGSFTCTLFAPFAGEDGLDSITTDDAVMAYFQKFFPDAIPMMPTLLEDWNRNPTSKLATVYSDPWYFEDWALLLGDSAHAIVPFYGQGMNACFEDCLVFDRILQEVGDEEWGDAIRTFYERRKIDTDAIARLALQNFVEMRSRVVDPMYLRRKKIDAALGEMFPQHWMALYSMVTFSTIPYATALDRSQRQDALLEKIGYDEIEKAIEQGPEATGKLLGFV
jgi:kynurenine 3-monooxygenase